MVPGWAGGFLGVLVLRARKVEVGVGCLGWIRARFKAVLKAHSTGYGWLIGSRMGASSVGLKRRAGSADPVEVSARTINGQQSQGARARQMRSKNAGEDEDEQWRSFESAQAAPQSRSAPHTRRAVAATQAPTAGVLSHMHHTDTGTRLTAAVERNSCRQALCFGAHPVARVSRVSRAQTLILLLLHPPSSKLRAATM
eukprot:scaffold10842_cov104-Isochrysis_galbana.AAC.4